MEVLTREDRIRKYGVDTTVEELVWSSWEPGGEYTKLLTLRNVTTDVMHINYELPKTQHFALAYPKTFQLAPGMSCALAVTLRPIEMAEYHDAVVLSCENGRFLFPIAAVLPHVAIELPTSLVLGLCAVRECTTATFTLRNTSTIPIDFSFEVPDLLSLDPSTGALAPGAAAVITASFTPSEAVAFSATLLCTARSVATPHEPPVVRELTVSGAAKYPYLALSTDVIQFGAVVASHRAESTFRVTNRSAVPTSFRITTLARVAEAPEPPFAFRPTRGVLPPSGAVDIVASFVSECAGVTSICKYTIETPGGNAMPLTVAGASVPPTVELSHRAVDFGTCAPGQESVRLLRVANTCGVPVAVQAVAEPDGVFTLDPVAATIAPFTELKMQLRFAAGAPANYVKRLFVLVADAAPRVVDLFGTVCTDTHRPPDMSMRLIERTRRRAAAGLDVHPPEQLAAVLSARRLGGVGSYDDGIDDTMLSTLGDELPLSPVRARGGAMGATRGPPPPSEAEAAASAALALWSEYLTRPSAASRPVRLSVDTLDFGYVAPRSEAALTVDIINETLGKVTAVLALPRSAAGLFTVAPESVDVLAGGRAAVRVTLSAAAADRVYGADADVIVAFKTMRNFRLVSAETATAPWPLSLRLIGHSFAGSGDEYIPQCRVVGGPGRAVRFRPVLVGQLDVQTVTLANTGQMSARFTALLDGSGVFRVWPESGVIQATSSQIFAVAFAPTAPRAYGSELRFVLNGTAANTLRVPVHGSASNARIVFETAEQAVELAATRGPGGGRGGSSAASAVAPLASGGGGGGGGGGDSDPAVLFFKPTCVGSGSARSFRMTNPGALPVYFKWKIPSRYAGQLAVVPAEGEITGGAETSVRWHFSPGEQKGYHLRAYCYSTNVRPRAAFRRDSRTPTPPPTPPPLLAAMRGATGRGVGAAAAAGEDATTELEGYSHKASLRLFGLGTAPALRFEPAELDFGSAAVGLPVSRTAAIANTGQADVRVVLSARRAAESDDDPASPGEDADPDSVVSITPRSVVVPARARVDIDVRLVPTARTLYRFELVGTVLPFHPDADLETETTFSPALPGSVGHAHSSCTPSTGFGARRPSTPPFGSSTGGTGGGGVAGSEGRLSCLHMCDVVCLGVLPALGIADVWTPNGAKGLIWARISADAINAELAGGLTEGEEVFVGARASHAAADPAAVDLLSGLPAFRMDLGAGLLRGPPTVMRLKLTNRGLSEVRFELLLPSDLEWTDIRLLAAYDVNEELLRTNKLFTISPRAGVVPPGASMHVEVLHHHLALDEHCMRVVLAIAGGKHLALSLHGTTVAPETPHVHVPSPVFELAAVPLGLETPLVQSLPITNEGVVPLRWTLDLSDLERLAAASYGYQVVRFLATEGTLEPGAVSFVRFVFGPIQPGRHAFRLPILATSLSDPAQGSCTALTVVGDGYLPQPQSVLPWAAAAPSSAPARADLDLIPSGGEWAGSLGLFAPRIPATVLDASHAIASLSIDRVWFGTVPMYSVNRAFVVVQNTSAVAAIEFEWAPLQGVWDYDLVQVEPAAGIIAPGEAAACVLTFVPAETPEIFEADVPCLIRVVGAGGSGGGGGGHAVDESLGGQGLNGSGAAGGGGGGGGGGEVEIFASDVAPNRRMSRVTGAMRMPGSQGRPRVSAVTGRPASRAGSALNPLRPLPRIDQRPSTALSVLSAAARPIAEGAAPPTSAALYVHISAASLRLEEYRADYAEAEAFFIPRNTVHETRDQRPRGALPSPTVSLIRSIQQVPSDRESKDVVAAVLAGLFQEVVFHPDLQETIQAVEQAPVPFFSQIVARETQWRALEAHVAARGSEVASAAGSPSLPPPPQQQQQQQQQHQQKQAAAAAAAAAAAPETGATARVDGLDVGGLPQRWQARQAAKVARPPHDTALGDLRLAHQVPLPGFDTLIEGVLAGTLRSLMEEALGDFEVTTPVMRVHVPPGPSEL